MEELSIVLGLIIFITVLIMYNKTQSNRPCDNYVTYFDKMYYDLPVLKTESPEVIEGMNDQLNHYNRAKPQHSNYDMMKTRWTGGSISQPFRDNMGRCQYTNTDKETNPLDLHHGCKDISNAYSHNKHKLGKSKYIPLTEPFADDEWVDPSFSYSDKYFFTGSDANDELLEIADDTKKSTDNNIRRIMHEPIRRKICKRKRARLKPKLFGIF